MTRPSLIPISRDLIGHRCDPNPHVKYGWIVTFDYPDCTRSFDGSNWTVTPKPVRPGA